MGSPENDPQRYADENQVSVTLTQGFWLMETECWQKLWEAVDGAGLDWENGRGDQYPVYDVSYDDSRSFAGKVMKHLRDSGQLDSGWMVTLPTSAQWEYAARAGSTTRYCYGDDDGRLAEYAWYKDNSGGTNHPVGTKRANAWGLHDMHGSVWEWCLDVWENPQSGGTDPMGPKEGSDRVYRGGSWNDSAGFCRSAFRYGYTPGLRFDALGFRLSLVPSRGG